MVVLRVAAVGVVVVRGAAGEIDVIDQHAHHRGIRDAEAVERLPDDPLADLVEADDPNDPVRQFGQGDGIGHGTDGGGIQDDAVVPLASLVQQLGERRTGKKRVGHPAGLLGYHDIEIR